MTMAPVPRTFHFDYYPNGEMTLDVGKFFGTAPASSVKKMLKLMRGNCHARQKEELLLDLIEEDRRRKELLDTLGDMEYTRQCLLSAYFDGSNGAVKRDLGWPEKALVKQREKIQAAVDMVKREEWF